MAESAESKGKGVATLDQHKEDEERLQSLTMEALAKDAMKDYEKAADLFSQATELQAKLKGEMCLDNADLLYMCGKSLYNLAVSRSDVLGSKVTVDIKSEAAPESSKTKPTNKRGKSAEEEPVDEEAKGDQENTGLFQFAGDENFEVSDEGEGEDAEEEEEQQQEEEDDFRNAWEVLDLARVLFAKRLEQHDSKDAGQAGAFTEDQLQKTRERLSDTHELQAEISLEDENFADAVSDYKTALKLKNELYSFDDQRVASLHYMLAVALEMHSTSAENEEGVQAEESATKAKQLRDEAVEHMETAIKSCRQRLSKENQRLNGLEDEGKSLLLKHEIKEVEELITDMEQRLSELRNPPKPEKLDPSGDLAGILGQMLGQPSTQQSSLLEQVTKNANDLSGL
ncbi:hypothetical protein KEM55_007429, partial [Ascosphaera atra]